MFPCPELMLHHMGPAHLFTPVVNYRATSPSFVQITRKDEQTHQEFASGQHQFIDRSLYGKVLAPAMKANTLPRLPTEKQKPRQVSEVLRAHPPNPAY